MTKSKSVRDSHSRKEAQAAGLLRYRSTIPCKRGHLAERLVSNGSCLECLAQTRAQKDRAYYLSHKDACKDRVRKWEKANPERVKENHRRKVVANPEKYQALSRERYALHRDKDMKRKRDHYHANRDVLREKQRQRYAADPTPWRVGSRNRKARVRGADGHHTIADIRRILDAQKKRCAWCQTSIARKYHVDHIKPLSRGGSNWPANLQLLCPSCNLRKRAHDPIDFARQEGRLL